MTNTTIFFKANNTDVIKSYIISDNNPNKIIYYAIWSDNNYVVSTPCFETVSDLMGYLHTINENNERDTHETEIFETIIDDLFKMPYVSKGKRVDDAYMLFTEYENDVDPSINNHALFFDSLAEFEASHCHELYCD